MEVKSLNHDIMSLEVTKGHFKVGVSDFLDILDLVVQVQIATVRWSDKKFQSNNCQLVRILIRVNTVLVPKCTLPILLYVKCENSEFGFDTVPSLFRGRLRCQKHLNPISSMLFLMLSPVESTSSNKHTFPPNHLPPNPTQIIT